MGIVDFGAGKDIEVLIESANDHDPAILQSDCNGRGTCRVHGRDRRPRPCIQVVNFGVCEVGRTVDPPVISAGHQDTAVQQLDGREKCACLIHGIRRSPRDSLRAGCPAALFCEASR